MANFFRRRHGRAVLALLSTLVLLLGLLGVSAPAAAAFQDGTEETQADATIRVVHASPGAPEVDVLLDGLLLAAAVPFASATDYVPLSPGDHVLQVVPTGGSPEDAVAQIDMTADPAAAYLFVAAGPLAEIEGRLYDVSLDDITPGNARVRVVNAASDADGLALAVTGGDTLFDGVAFGDATDYIDLAAGAYSFDLRGADDQTLATVPELAIEEAAAYDMVAIGAADGQGPSLLPLVTQVSPPCGPLLGLGAGDEACVRLVHAAPDAPAVDIYVNDSLLAEGLEFGTGTEYVAVPSGDGRALRISASGTPIEEAIVSSDLALDAGQAYTALVTGTTDDLQLVVTGTDLRPIPENQARLGVINASPDVGALSVELADGATIVSDLGFRAIGPYVAIDVGEYTLHLRRQDGDNLIALATDLVVEPGTVYDAIAIGRYDDESLALLVLTAPTEVRQGAIATPGAAVTAGAADAETVTPASTPTTANEATAIAETAVSLEPVATATAAP